MVTKSYCSRILQIIIPDAGVSLLHPSLEEAVSKAAGNVNEVVLLGKLGENEVLVVTQLSNYYLKIKK